MKGIRLLTSVVVDGALTLCSCGVWLGMSQDMGGTFTQREMEHQRRVEREKIVADAMVGLLKIKAKSCPKN